MRRVQGAKVLRRRFKMFTNRKIRSKTFSAIVVLCAVLAMRLSNIRGEDDP